MSHAVPEALSIDPLTREAFAPYGDVLGGGQTPTGILINAGTTLKIDAVDPVLSAQDGHPKLFVYRTQAQALPLTLSMLECHQLGSQTFVPLADLSFVVVVARSASDTASPQPDLSTLRAFWVDGHQGVTLAPGIWHHPLISLHDGELVVLERAALQTDCLIHPLLTAVTLKARAL